MMNIKYLIWSLCLPTSPPAPSPKERGKLPSPFGEGPGVGLPGMARLFS